MASNSLNRVEQLLQYLCAKDLSHSKYLSHIQESASMKEELECFLEQYEPFLTKNKISLKSLGDAYLQLVSEIQTARLHFMRTGSYPNKDAEKVKTDVYHNPVYMTQYILGLGLSQFLWKHHYEVYRYFQKQIGKYRSNGAILDVGPGHGIFLKRLLRELSSDTNITVIDISDHALKITSDLLAETGETSQHNIKFLHQNVLDFDGKTKFDFINMGEVLEHVHEPRKLLEQLRSLLADNGILFISTCANCPTVDHLFHFKTVDEIRKVLSDSKLQIDDEIVVPSMDIEEDKAEKLQIDVIYAAFLRAQD